MKTMLRPLLVLFALLTVLTGLVYPLLVTGIGKIAFPNQVSGSLVVRDDKVVGSMLISQSFQDPKYFWGRLSATSPMPNNASASGGSNFGPTNPALIEAVRARIEALKTADPDNALPIPVDLVTASASGLDPDISPAAALYQVARVARIRHIDPAKLRERVLAQMKAPLWGIFGESRVNVLMLNLGLDGARP
ncbi:MAG TPA: potassium-transporting ATPase subunit KdpC [Steroidobacteraceae bacterium]|nr:potassium-transporting ATPase subunit KdpC [Steroidobacteraceae bacterium]